MADREKVIKALECCQMVYECKPYEKCPYSNGLECGDCDINRLHYDALALLKKQEAQRFLIDENGKITPLPVVVRCKDCKYRGDSEKCVLSAISEEKDFPLFMLDNRGEWFCADGVAKDVPNKEGR